MTFPVQDVMAEIRKRVVGQERMVERLLIGLLTGGHVLLEGVPGLAKTLTVRTLADVLHASFSRIQFTPDLLPADVVGTMIFDSQRQQFTVRHGPIFAQIVLADEVNRAPGQGAVGAARSDAGAPGHDRRRRHTSCPTRSWCWRRRTRSSRKAPIPCRKRSSIASAPEDQVDQPVRAEEREVLVRMSGTNAPIPVRRLAEPAQVLAARQIAAIHLDPRLDRLHRRPPVRDKPQRHLALGAYR